eukprot:15366315-Ditylum_brightwellii.AAC.2
MVFSSVSSNSTGTRIYPCTTISCRYLGEKKPRWKELSLQRDVPSKARKSAAMVGGWDELLIPTIVTVRPEAFSTFISGYTTIRASCVTPPHRRLEVQMSISLYCLSQIGCSAPSLSGTPAGRKSTNTKFK